MSPAVEVEALHFADLRAPHAYVFRPQRRVVGGLLGFVRPSEPPLALACLAYVLRHPEAGTVLVDTGLHPAALRSVRQDFGPVMGTMFGGLRPTGEAFDAQLRGAGVDPLEVSRVVMTHLHVDHTSGMRLLPNARFTLAGDEWRAATGPRAVLRGYVASHLPAADRVDLLDLDADAEPFSPFERTVDLLGDGSIRLVSTPGHTRGHLSVLVRLPDGRPLLLVGDAAYTRRAIDEQRLPLLTDDDGRARASLRQLAAFAAQAPAALLVPSHDPEAWKGIAPPG